jgi:hypothetical protein
MFNPKYNINDLLRRDVSIIYTTRFIIHSLRLFFFNFLHFLVEKQIRENNDQNYENEILKYYKERHER